MISRMKSVESIPTYGGHGLWTSVFNLQSPEGHLTYPSGQGGFTRVSGFLNPSSIGSRYLYAKKAAIASRSIFHIYLGTGICLG